MFRALGFKASKSRAQDGFRAGDAAGKTYLFRAPYYEFYIHIVPQKKGRSFFGCRWCLGFKVQGLGV